MIAPILTVKDVDASVAFYTEKLGFTKMFTMPGEDGASWFAFVSLGPAIQIGLSRDPDLQHRGQGVQLMLYIPDDIDLDKHYADVQARQVEIYEPLEDAYWGDHIFSVHDPDGYYITFARTVKQMSPEEVAANMPRQNP